MAQIFLSYSRDDQQRAAQLAAALERLGQTVWWDRHIVGGAEFSKDIEKQLAAAEKVLVLWSTTSIHSRWVRDEASVAADSGRLVGASLDGTDPPLGFRQFQTVDLRDWDRSDDALPPALAHALDPAQEGPPPPVSPSRPRKSRKLLAAGLSAAALLALGAGYFLDVLPGQQAEQASAANLATLAVMPFDVLGGNEQDYLGSGLSSAINNALADLPGIALIASSSASALAERNLTAAELGGRLGARYLVEGSVQPQGEEVRIAISLVDAQSSRQLWSKDYADRAENAARLTHDIAGDLAIALQARLGVAQTPIQARANVDPRAFDAYLRGLEAMSARHDDLRRLEAYTQFSRAAEIAPDFAEAHAGRAYLLALSRPRILSLTEEEALRAFEQSAGRALELQPGNPLARAARVHGLLASRGDIDAALPIARKLVAEHPEFGPGHYAAAHAHLLAGDDMPAIRHFERALAHDPFNRVIRIALVATLQERGHYDRLRDLVTDCADCSYITASWAYAIATLADRATFERDWPIMSERALKEGVPAPLLEEGKRITGALVDGRTISSPADFFWDPPTFGNLVLLSQVGHADRALDLLDDAADRSIIMEILSLTGEGRGQMSEAVRADPRYHALFERPAYANIARYRREKGRLRGLPVFPVRSLDKG